MKLEKEEPEVALVLVEQEEMIIMMMMKILIMKTCDWNFNEDCSFYIIGVILNEFSIIFIEYLCFF